MAFVQECVSEQQLRDYLLGRLDDPESELVEAHLRDCAECEESASHLEAEDTLAAHLRSIADVDPLIEDERFVASAERAKRMIPSLGRAPTDRQEEDLSAPTHGDGPLGSYELLERIGRGGMGAVYRGRHRRLDRIVAIKLLPSRFIDDPEAIARFQREMRMVGRLHHQAIVTATDAGEHRGTHYLVMELVDGLDLARIARAVGPLPIREACELVRQTALGLDYAHAQGVVHRDIKPSNLMLDRQGRVKILDLGLAQLGPWQQPVDELTTVGQLMGTLDYMAPEQAESGQPTNYRADLYSLGATLFRLLCGRAPYAVTPYLSPLEKLRLLANSDPPKLATLRADAPPELCELVDQLLSRAPADRPAGAAVVADRLERLSKGAAVVSLLDQASERIAEEPAEEKPPRTATSAPMIALPAVGKGNGRRGWKRIVAMAAMFPLLIAAGVLVVLETNKGQIVIESEAADVQVRLMREGEPVENLTVQHGANATRVRSGQYEVVIAQPSDELVISDNTFTLRRGETVVTRITRRSAAERGTSAWPSASATALAPAAGRDDAKQGTPPAPTYQGKTLDEWLAILDRERAPEEVREALQAIDVLADPESGQRVSNIILRAIRQLPEIIPGQQRAFDVGGFHRVKKLLEPQAVMELLIEQLAIDDPNWQRRVLEDRPSLIDLESYPGPLDPLVDRVAPLALDQEPALAGAALAELLKLVAVQESRGKSVDYAVKALEQGLRVRPAAARCFEEFALDPSWPESLQRIFLRWSEEQLTAEDVSDEVLMRALANVSANIDLAVEIFPDLPQTIAAQFARHVDPLPTKSSWGLALTPPFARVVAARIKTRLGEIGIDIYSQSNTVAPPASEFRAAPALLLASLAGEPILRTEEGVQILRSIVSELAPNSESLPEGLVTQTSRIFFPSLARAGDYASIQLWLYLISRASLAKLEPGESIPGWPSQTAPK